LKEGEAVTDVSGSSSAELFGRPGIT